MGLGSKLLTAGFSRKNEFQADRGAVELGGNPLALITALRKIDVANTIISEQINGAPLPEKGFLARVWTQATSTHPSTKRRAAALATIARKHSYGETAITAAMNDPVNVDSTDFEKIGSTLRFI